MAFCATKANATCVEFASELDENKKLNLFGVVYANEIVAKLPLVVNKFQLQVKHMCVNEGASCVFRLDRLFPIDEYTLIHWSGLVYFNGQMPLSSSTRTSFESPEHALKIETLWADYVARALTWDKYKVKVLGVSKGPRSLKGEECFDLEAKW